MKQKILTERQADRQWNKRYSQKDRQTVEQKIFTERQTETERDIVR